MAQITPLKLVFILPSLKSGGGNRVFIELANVLAEDYESVSIMYANNSDTDAHYHLSDKIKLQKIGKLAGSIVQKVANANLVIKNINKILREEQDTFVIISDPILSIFFTFFGVKDNGRIIRFIQADDYQIYDDLFILKKKFVLSLYKRFCIKTYKNFDNYIFNSAYTYHQFNEIDKRALPLYLVHPGIDTNIFKPAERPKASGINICMIARTHPWKGFQDFLDAWKLLPEKVRTSINNIAVISHDDLGRFEMPEKFNHVKPANDLEIAGLMNDAQLFISTSWWEGFGLPPLEAMACGCAVLSSNSKGVLEYAKDNHNCILYEPKNVLELSQKLEKLIAEPETATRIAANGITDAKQFTWINAGKQFDAYIKERHKNLQKL